LGLSVSIFGLGYVGSVSAACFSSMGHKVIGVDVSRAKVEMLDSGRTPIVEARMAELVAEANKACRLHATTDANQAVLNSDVSFVCVGTPSLKNGKLDLSHIENVAREIGAAIRQKKAPHVFVLRSTVLPGTTENVVLPILERESGKQCGRDFTVCYNPEFMREGSAVADFLNPPYTILGASDTNHLAPLRELYKDTPGTLYETTIPVAEMVKYFSNCYHALKVGFANEMGTMCKHLGVDAQAVTKIFTSDTKLNISPAYLSPGFAFGGSCLPKDVRAILHTGKDCDLQLPVIAATLLSNECVIERAFKKIRATGKRRLGLIGLSFKSNTDDLRESPFVELAERLLGKGYELSIYDPNVIAARLTGASKEYIDSVIPHLSRLLVRSLDELSDAELLIVGHRFEGVRELLENTRRSVIDVNEYPTEMPAGARESELVL